MPKTHYKALEASAQRDGWSLLGVLGETITTPTKPTLGMWIFSMVDEFLASQYLITLTNHIIDARIEWDIALLAHSKIPCHVVYCI